MNKIKTGLILSILTFLGVGMINFSFACDGLRNYAASETYQIQLTGSNGKTGGSYNSNPTTIVAKTNLQNNITLQYTNSMASSDSGFIQIKGTSGSYYMNVDPINLIYKIEINYKFSGDNGSASLELGNYANNSFTSANSMTINSSTSYVTKTYEDFSSSYSYFRIIQESNRALYIKSITISYHCVESSSTTKPVKGIEVSPNELELDVGDTYGLSKQITPNDATNQNVTWSSSNSEIASVDQNGLVTAKNSGNTIIKCVTEDGGFSDECEVTVNSTGDEPVTSGQYTLVENASQLVSGANVVIALRSEAVIAGALSSTYLSKVNLSGFDSSGSTLSTIPDDAIEFTLEGSAGAWKFKYNDTYLSTTGEKKISFSGTVNTWEISINESLATIQSTTDSYGRILYNSGSPRFTTYTSSTSHQMHLPELFIKGSGSGDIGGEEDPIDPPAVEPAKLISVNISTRQTTYDIGQKLDTSLITITGTFDDNTTKNYSWNEISEYDMLDSQSENFFIEYEFEFSGEHILTVTIDGVESNILSIFVNEEEVEEPDNQSSTATISIQQIDINSNTDISSSFGTYITTDGINISSTSGSKVFPVSNTNGLKLGSKSSGGSVTFNFDTNILITSVGLKVSRYDGETTTLSIKTVSEKSFDLESDYTNSYYVIDSFSSDTTLTSSLTISSSSRFNLHEISLTFSTNVEVQDIPVTKVFLSSETLNLNIGSSSKLTATIVPSNATNKTLTWSSDASAVASVSTEGVVTANNVGTANIKVTTSNGFYDTVKVNVTETEMDNYYVPSTIDQYFSLKDIQETMGCSSIPLSSDTTNILVIPVEVEGYAFTDKILSDLDIAFNGTDESSLYWESVASFYDKSSFNNVDLNFEIADVYECGYTPSEIENIYIDNSYYLYPSQKILEYSVSNYKKSNSTTKFDSDNDGFIDAVWMVYSCPNYSNESSLSKEFWAYVYYNNWNANPSTSSPVGGIYGWASYDFMYDKGTSKVDAHTYIHETGHLFGLEDYYNYDSSKETCLSGVDMMDYNVIDHNVWSKMLLGWVKPYVVTGNVEITINPSTLTGECILIPSSKGWNGTSYDEFILLELYSPVGLNEKDATTSYNSADVFTEAGVRLYHVDSRLIKYRYSYQNGWGADSYVEPSSINIDTIDGYTYYSYGASNTPSRNEMNSNFRLITMVQAGGNNTYKNGGSATNGDLFQTNDVFTMDSYGANFFPNKTTFNNGYSFDYKITFVNVSSTNATIRITKI